MANTKYLNIHPTQLNFDEYLTEDALKVIQPGNHPSPNFYLNPGGEKPPQTDWIPFMDTNDQALANFDITDDSFLNMFDGIIQSPATDLIANDKPPDQLDGSETITEEEFGSDDHTSDLSTETRETNSITGSSQVVSSPALNSHKPPEEKSTNPKETNSTITTSSSAPLAPKKKRRARAKKILTPAETLLAREKYLDKNRRAARKCRVKKKTEMAADQAKHDYYASEIEATRRQLDNSQKELLGLIQMCRGMVGEGCNDSAIRQFVGNWERRVNASRGMLQSGDQGVEAMKVVERCRSARLGEGVLGDVELEGWQQMDCANGDTTGAEDPIFDSSGMKEFDDAALYGSCQFSSHTQQPLPQLVQHSSQVLQHGSNINWHGMVSSLQQASRPDHLTDMEMPTTTDNSLSFSPSNFTPVTQSMSSPQRSFNFPSAYHHQDTTQPQPQPSIPTSASLPQLNTKNGRQHQRESIDSGYRSISSASPSHSHPNSFSSSSNTSAASSQTSTTNPNCWSPDLGGSGVDDIAENRNITQSATNASRGFMHEKFGGVDANNALGISIPRLHPDPNSNNSSVDMDLNLDMDMNGQTTDSMTTTSSSSPVSNSSTRKSTRESKYQKLAAADEKREMQMPGDGNGNGNGNSNGNGSGNGNGNGNEHTNMINVS